MKYYYLIAIEKNNICAMKNLSVYYELIENNEIEANKYLSMYNIIFDDMINNKMYGYYLINYDNIDNLIEYNKTDHEIISILNDLYLLTLYNRFINKDKEEESNPVARMQSIETYTLDLVKIIYDIFNQNIKLKRLIKLDLAPKKSQHKFCLI